MINTDKQTKLAGHIANIERLRDEQAKLLRSLVGSFMREIEITEKDFKNLKIAYKKAVEENAQSFFFVFINGGRQELVTSYAKYLIEYIKGRGGKNA